MKFSGKNLMKSLIVDCSSQTEEDLDRLFGASSVLPPVLQNAVAYRSFSPYTEVSGWMISKMLEACGGYLGQVQRILNRFGIGEIQPKAWYPEQAFLDALSQVAEETSPVLLNQMGAALVEMVFCLPDAGVEESILLLNQYFHRWHRRGEPGDYRLLQSNPDGPSMLVQCRHPYPCAMDMGLLRQLVKRITGKRQVMVLHDYRQSQRCRTTGAGVCNLVVAW
jgi:hypothetical protein